MLGSPVRYNSTDLFIDHPLLKQWQQQNRLVSICPEVTGGLPTPRAPAEIIRGDGESVLLKQTTVIDNQGTDVTEEFISGAEKALLIALANNCVAAILTERSPSCGSSLIYDGSFSRVRKTGMGVTTALLHQNGIRVFNQHQIDDLELLLSKEANITKFD